MEQDVIISDRLELTGTSAMNSYLTHVYCYAGSCAVDFNGGHFVLESGSCMIIISNRLVESVVPNSDFVCKAIYIKDTFIERCTPEGTNYDVKGTFSLFLNPVMQLNAEEQELCRADFENVEQRLRHTEHHFYMDVLMSTIETLFLDFYEFHARIYGHIDVPVQGAQLLSRFIDMLESGSCRTHREVAYYASQLCIVPKYLSELCLKYSGYTAQFWIKRFTMREIKMLLRDKSLTITQIADALNFSSTAYFNRYVHNALGVSPSEYRR